MVDPFGSCNNGTYERVFIGMLPGQEAAAMEDEYFVDRSFFHKLRSAERVFDPILSPRPPCRR
jgi:hypothetical protein